MLEAMWRMTLELAPWMLLGAAIAGAMHAFLPKGLLPRLLGGRGAVWKSVLVGIPLPLCSCAVIPVGLGLKRQGASDGASVAFLIATPQTGVDSILVTAGLLGWPLALFKVATALVTGLVGGWLTDATTPERFSLPIVEKERPATGAPSFFQRVIAGAVHADELIRSIWKWLLVGVALSAAITFFVPEDWLGGIGAYGGAAAMGAALALSLPLYVCATASVPIAAALVAAGLPMGAVIVFLMAGPATNAATIGAVYRGLGWRALVAYLLVIVVGSIVGGLIYEAWLAGAALPTVATLAHDHAHAADWWRSVAAGMLVAWVAWCAARDFSASREHDHNAPKKAGGCCASNESIAAANPPSCP
ncbi:putative permease [Botrimarina colliarenosi]|uniref:Putative permease n=1 Tax=Botrimarina colliarenosi TaxID=2528001 RepID=A0A5C6ABP2_9BACT|nr:permease [Botrimarina colliarenosi]TWT96820.1 putative permease [Botrimarina colliarenosi]